MPRETDIVRRAYELWQENGQPEGRDEEFYLQAERELKEAEERGGPPHRKRAVREKDMCQGVATTP